MAERKRDYKAEYAREKKRGYKRPAVDLALKYANDKASGKEAEKEAKRKKWNLVVPNEEVPGVLQVLERCRCKTPSELIRKLGRGELFVYASSVTKNIMDNDEM